MLAENLGNPGRQGLGAVEYIRETGRVRLVQIEWHVAVDDASRERHSGTAAGRNADRVHAAAQEQAAGLGWPRRAERNRPA